MADTVIRIEIDPLTSDPDIPVGGFITVERSDGRSVWKQRLMCEAKTRNKYRFVAVDEFGCLIT